MVLPPGIIVPVGSAEAEEGPSAHRAGAGQVGTRWAAARRFNNQRGQSSVGYLGLVAIMLGGAVVVMSSVEGHVAPHVTCLFAKLLGSTAECAEPMDDGDDSLGLGELRSMPWVEGRSNQTVDDGRTDYLRFASSEPPPLTDAQLRLQAELRDELMDPDVSSVLPLEVTLPLTEMIFYQSSEFYWDDLNRRLLEFRIALARDHWHSRALSIVNTTRRPRLPPFSRLRGTITEQEAIARVRDLITAAKDVASELRKGGPSLLSSPEDRELETHLRNEELKAKLSLRWEDALSLRPPYDVDMEFMEGIFLVDAI